MRFAKDRMLPEIAADAERVKEMDKVIHFEVSVEDPAINTLL